MDDSAAPPPIRPSRLARALRHVGEAPAFGWYVGERFWFDHCFSKAATLSYNALFAVVPLAAVGLAILKGLPPFEAIRERLITFILSNFLPANVDEFRLTFDRFMENTAGLTAIGAFALAVTAIILFETVEGIFNDIWRQTAIRPFVSRMVMFWAIITLGPLLVGVSFALSVLIVDSGGVAKLGLGGVTTVLVWLLPLLLLIAAFTLAYLVIPYRRVRLHHALAGATVAALLFQLFRWGFTEYITAFPTYRTLYGTLSIVPIFLLYVYLACSAALFGAEIVAALPEWRRRPGAGVVMPSWPLRRLTAALLMLERLFEARRPGVPVRTDALADLAADALAERDRGAAQELLDGLAKARLIGRAEEGGWYLARDPEGITVGQVVAALDLSFDSAGDVGHLAARWSDGLKGALAAYGDRVREALAIDLETLFGGPIGRDRR
jgi:membrane protein